MIYELNSLSDLWSLLPNAKKWKFVNLPNGHIAANLEWRENYTSELTPMADTAQALSLYPALNKL